MKKLLLLPIFIMAAQGIFAQLHVAANDYVYVSHDFLYVKQETSLDGNLYLRNESQLLQGNDISTSFNRGQGILSVYQEGTSDNYEYNFWCSPIGDPYVYGSGNKNFWIHMLYRPVTAILSTPAIVINHDIDGVDGISNPLSIADRWIFRLTTAAYYFQLADTSSGTQVSPGEGFTMKGTAGTDPLVVLGVQNNPGSNQRYDFRGSPNNGSINSTLFSTYSELTGNPYPSAIDLSMFLTDATACTGIAYFWEMDKDVNSHYESDYVGGYGTFSPVSRGGTGIYVPAVYTPFLGGPSPDHHYERRFSPIGQGFIIERLEEGNGEITMKNIYRVFVPEGAEHQSEFERNATAHSGFLPKIQSISGFDYTKVSTAAVPQVRLATTINGKWIRETAVAFDDRATDAADHAMDGRLYDKYPADSYFVIGKDKEYAIDVMSFDIHKKIPIGFRNNEMTKFSVSLKEIMSLSAVENVYLHDKKTDEYFDIRKNAFELTLPKGTNNDQFELTFEKNTALNVNALTENKVDIFQNNNSKIAIIQNESNLMLKDVIIYDLNGKNLIEKNNLGNNASYEFSTSALADGVYIAKITDESGNQISKKINIKN